MKKGKPIKQRFLKLPGGEGALALPRSSRERAGLHPAFHRACRAVQENAALRAMALGLLWLLVSLATVMMLMPEGESVAARYEAVSTGEIRGYEEVMEGGLARLSREKMPPTPGSAATMLAQELQVAPGYPLVALLGQKAMGAMAVVTGQPAPGARLALSLTAQLMTWVLWGYVVAFLGRWKVRPVIGLLTAALLMLHPEALALVGIGPGSLFLAMLLGMVFWAGLPGGGLVSAVHAAGASAARLFVAVPVILSGLLLVRRKRRRGVAEGIRSVERRAWIAILALLPLGLYLAVLQGRFGAIDLYLKALGLTSATFTRLGEPWELWESVATHLGERTLAVWTGLAALFIVAELYLLLQEMWFRAESRFRARAPFYLMGAVFFVLAVVGTALALPGGEGAVVAAGEGSARFLLQPLGFGFELYLMVILAFSHILSRLATRTLPGKAVTVIVVGLMVFLQFWAREGRGLVSLLE